jgi:hypothetical protein
LAQIRGDLLRASLQLQLGVHLGAQLRIVDQARPARPPSSLSGAGVGEIAVVAAAVARQSVAAQLAPDRRPCPPNRSGDRTPRFCRCNEAIR